MNVQLARVARTAMGLVIALIVATTYWQTWARPGLAARQDNEIQRVAEFEVRRGKILAPTRVLARNRVVVRRGKKLYFRKYPQGKLAAHIVGYSTVSRSRAGLEKSLNGILTGTERNLAGLVERQLDELRGKPIVGDTIVTTLDIQAQRVALEALGRLRRRGGARPAQREAPRDGVVAELQPEPRREQVRPDREDHRGLPPGGAARQPCLAGPLRARLDVQGRDARRRARVESLRAGFEIRRSGVLHRLRQASQQLRHEPPFGSLTLATALQHSVNSVFCNIGKAIGAKRILDQARKFGFYERPPLETPDGERLPSGLYREASCGSRSATRTSTPAGWRSARSGCS